MATQRNEQNPTNDRTGNNPTNKADKVTNESTRVTNAGPQGEGRNEAHEEEEERTQPRSTNGDSPETQRPGENDKRNNPNAIDRGSERKTPDQGRYDK